MDPQFSNTDVTSLQSQELIFYNQGSPGNRNLTPHCYHGAAEEKQRLSVGCFRGLHMEVVEALS